MKTIQRKALVIHTIPADGIGGVEVAAHSMVGVENAHINFQVNYIRQKNTSQRCRLSRYYLSDTLIAVYHILSRKPDLLVVSLWRSCIVGIVSKIFRPKLQVVLFLHSSEHTHWVDRALTSIMAKFSLEIWADSSETLKKRIPGTDAGNNRVISFVINQAPPLVVRPVKPKFIFWGRLHPQKNLARAIDIFARVHAVHPDAVFILIGPDGGELSRIQTMVNDIGLTDSVHFLGRMDFNDISHHAQSACFYLQTSKCEGMAMSVVEAMQLGLVPIVTPVGEIQHYAQHRKNSIIIIDNLSTVAEILLMLKQDSLYQSVSQMAFNAWKNHMLYKDSVIGACLEVLDCGREVNS